MARIGENLVSLRISILASVKRNAITIYSKKDHQATTLHILRRRALLAALATGDLEVFLARQSCPHKREGNGIGEVGEREGFQTIGDSRPTQCFKMQFDIS